MAEMNIPGWFRWILMLFGLVIIILAAALFVLLIEYYLFIVIVVIFILIGFLSIIRVFIKFRGWLRFLKLILNIIIIILAIVVYMFYGVYPIEWLFWMLSVGLILDGLDWLLVMFVAGPEGVYKWLGLLFGLIELVLAAVVFVMIAYAWWLLAGAVILSGLNLLINGFIAK
ncbi:hypothetical protein E2P64_07240 [Candidatus Bathyarchaeota archaeon]|nr:hypothetical protein E2P64_07240 [Candidatus Bathyarchaeota archaeon]